MKWLAVTGDLAFNLLFAALAFATLEQASWTPFAAPADLDQVEVVVSSQGHWLNDAGGLRRSLAGADLEGKFAVLAVTEEYPGMLTDLGRIKGRLARAGVLAFREEVSLANVGTAPGDESAGDPAAESSATNRPGGGDRSQAEVLLRSKR